MPERTTAAMLERGVSSGRISRGTCEGPNEKESRKVMTLGTTEHRKLGPSSRIMAGGGESSAGVERDEVGMACRVQEGLGQEGSLLVQALSRENLAAAWKRVKANGGSAGVDGLTVTETQEYLKTHWPCLKAEILDGTYQPQAVRRVEIPTPTGGKRELGIPTHQANCTQPQPVFGIG